MPKDHEYAIVTHLPAVGDRRYSSEEEARIDALERAKATGCEFIVVKFIGRAVCHKRSTWEPES